MMAAHVRDRYAFQGAGGEIRFLLSRAVHSEKSGREKRMVRGRILHLSKATVPALAAAFVGFATLNSACSLLFSTSKEQCKSDDECRARGAGFENTRCSLESLCVAGPEVDAAPPADAAAPDAAPDAADAAIDPFACATLPAINPDPSRKVDVSIQYLDYTNGIPPTGVGVRLCASTDNQCNNPRNLDAGGPADAGPEAGAGFVVPTAEGWVAATVEYGFEGFFEVKSGAYAPTFRYTSPPLRAPKTDFLQLMLRPQEISYLADTALGKPNAYDSVNHALVFVFARDCNNNPLSGVRFTTTALDPLLVPFYIIGSTPEIGADKKTDPLGRAGFINIPPGFHTFTAEWADSGKRIGSTRTLIRAGAATSVAVFPSPP